MMTDSKVERPAHWAKYNWHRGQFRGVSWSKQAKKWAAQITHGGGTHYLGYFHDPRRAAQAFDNYVKRNNLTRIATNDIGTNS